MIFNNGKNVIDCIGMVSWRMRSIEVNQISRLLASRTTRMWYDFSKTTSESRHHNNAFQFNIKIFFLRFHFSLANHSLSLAIFRLRFYFCVFCTQWMQCATAAFASDIYRVQFLMINEAFILQ